MTKPEEWMQMRSGWKVFIAAAAVAVLGAPAPARADGFVSPWAAVQFGGKITNASGNIDNGRAAVGVTAGGMGAGIIGGEVDFGYSPSFFGTSNDFGNNTVIDVMGNIIVGIPIGGTTGGGVRPFVSGGVGLIRTQIDGGGLFNVSSSVSNNQFGFNFGGGVMGFFTDHFGLRGDIRYMRVFTGDPINGLDLGRLNFTRLSVGVVFR
jgi:Outer membrane protein beta-barrel domain